MKLITITITLPVDCLTLNDTGLGGIARAALCAEVQRSATAKEAGRLSAIEKLGDPVTIDGVCYLSKAQARKVLGITPHMFAKKYNKTNSS